MPEQVGLISSFYLPVHGHYNNQQGGKLSGMGAISAGSLNLSYNGLYYIGSGDQASNNFNFFNKNFGAGTKTNASSYTTLWTFTARANIYFTIEIIATTDPSYAGKICVRDGTTIISPEYDVTDSGIDQKFTWSNYYQIGKTYNIAAKCDGTHYIYLNQINFLGFYNNTYGANFLYQYAISPPAPALTT
jgi:hypothetical protein